MVTIFTYSEGSLLIRLLIAHIITDFLLQTSKGIDNKKNKLLYGQAFWLHGLYTAIAVIILTWGNFSILPIGILVVSHMVIDYIKIFLGKRIKDGESNQKELWLFICDQILHIAIIMIVWLMMIRGFSKMQILIANLLPDYRVLLRVLGYLIVVGPVTYLVKFLTQKWSRDVINEKQSLKDAGKWIGILERVIVVTLVFVEQFTAIGFLATTKSILRLIDKPEPPEDVDAQKDWSARKHTEYVLIGTFLSFGAALITGIIINRLLKL